MMAMTVEAGTISGLVSVLLPASKAAEVVGGPAGAHASGASDRKTSCACVSNTGNSWVP